MKNKPKASLAPNPSATSSERRASIKMGLSGLHIPKKSAELVKGDSVISPALSLGVGLSPTI